MDEQTRRVKQLAEKLSNCKDIASDDSTGVEEAWGLAHILVGIDASARMIANQHMPKLSDGQLNDAETKEALLEIGEELRNILMQLDNSRFYEYLTLFAAAHYSGPD
jgi:hypothetical protein